MKILVCFKAVPEFEQVVDADWDHFDLAAGVNYVKTSFGCFDETALETALRLKDELKKQGDGVDATECCAVTLGFLPSPLCATLFAAGFDRVCAMGDAAAPRAAEFRFRETAAALGKFITGGGWDLILAGRQAGYADTGMVPLLLAEYLHIPVISNAETLSLVNGGGGAPRAKSITIDKSVPQGRERITISLPAVVLMGNSPVSALRAATLTARMQAAKRVPELAAGLSGSPPASPLLLRERKVKTCRFLDGGSDLDKSAGEVAECLREWGVMRKFFELVKK